MFRFGKGLIPTHPRRLLSVKMPGRRLEDVEKKEEKQSGGVCARENVASRNLGAPRCGVVQEVRPISVVSIMQSRHGELDEERWRRENGRHRAAIGGCSCRIEL